VLDGGTPRRVFRAVRDAEVVFWGLDSSPPPVPDAGPPPDSGLLDAGPPADGAPVDAGPPVDAALDAGFDAGP
jgi:hypothetical protein